MRTLAVLISGGLDSAILLGDAVRRGDTVFPIYIQCGLAWESVESAYLHRYLDALACPGLQELVTLDQPIADVYGPHWSITGNNVPGAMSADEAVFLPGRNVLLLAKSLLWCHLHQIPAIALGSLPSNPFPDATPGFFHSIQEVVDRAMQGRVEVQLPFRDMTKSAVMALGAGLPLEHTFSCMAPKKDKHCGACNKCAERQHAFAAAKLRDPTMYDRGDS